MDFDLRAAGVIFGYVYAGPGEGSPIENAEVLVTAAFTESGDDTWHIDWSTDADGYYEIFLAPTDTAIYPVQILQAGDRAVQLAPDVYSAALGGTRGPDFHLSAGGVLHGRVTTEAGDPVTNLSVISPETLLTNGVWDASTGFTDDNGEYWLQGVPTGMDIYLRTADWAWEDFAIGDNHYAWGERYVGPFNVNPGEQVEVGTLTVPLAGEVRGVVTDADGLPIVGASVGLTGVDIFGGGFGSDDEAVTDALGQYSFEWVPPASVTLTVSKDGWVGYSSEQPLVVTRGDELLHDVVLSLAQTGVSVSGMVVNIGDIAPMNAAGDILPFNIIEDYHRHLRTGEIGVVAYAPDFPWTVQNMLGLSESSFTVFGGVEDGWEDFFLPGADPAGGYEMDLPAGQHLLGAFALMGPTSATGADHILVSDVAWVSGAPGDVIGDVDVSIPNGTATVQGSVSFPAGHPGILSENSALVMLRQVDGNDSVFGRAFGWPGPSNEYGLGSLPAGEYYIYAIAEGVEPYTSAPFTVVAGATLVHDIVFDLGAIATGTVTSEGLPVEGATITSQGTGNSTTAGADGIYELVGLVPGNDTLTASMPGFAPLELTIDLISGNQAADIDFALIGDTATLTGTVRNVAGDLLGGATVVAYHTASGVSTSTTTVAGVFNFDALIPGDYALAAYLPGLETTVYGGDGATITLGSDADVDLGDLAPDHIALTAAGPEFSVSSFADAGTLDVTFYSDIALAWADPSVVLLTGAGTLGAAVVNGQNVTIAYTIDAADTLVELTVSGTANSILASRTFGFDVGGLLVEQEGTTFFNAEGASVAMSGVQDVSSVYVPPFALVGGDDTQAITLTATRFGDPGQSLSDDYDSVSGVYDFSFTDDGELADVTLQHSATVTLSFTKPQGMTQAEFEASLVIGFNNEALDEWVWNDLANSNPASGVGNIRVNWVNNTITFEASHFTEFAAGILASALPDDPDFTFEGKDKVQVIEPDGTTVDLSIKGLGVVEVWLGGDDFISRIELTGTDQKSALTIKTGKEGDGQASITDITADGSMAAILGKTTNLLGDLTVAGTLKTLLLNDVADNHVITIGAPVTIKDTLTVTFAEVTDLTFNSLTPIKAFAFIDWQDTDATPDQISAPWLGKLTSKGNSKVGLAGDFPAGLLLDGSGNPKLTLASAKIAGDLGTGDPNNPAVWEITGNVGAIDAAAGSTNGWALELHSEIKSIKLGLVEQADLTIGDEDGGGKRGDAGAISATQWNQGSILAGSIKALATKADSKVAGADGDFRANVTLTGSANVKVKDTLSSAKISGDLGSGDPGDPAVWEITGNVGAIDAAKGSTSGWTLNLHSDIKSIKLGLVEQADLTIGDEDGGGKRGDVGAISATQWNAGEITAGSIKSLATKANSKLAGADGDFAAELELTGSSSAKVKDTLGSAKISGDLGSGDPGDPVVWDITGNVGTIDAAKGTTSGWMLDLHSDVKAVKLGFVEQADLTIGEKDGGGLRGDAGSISATQWNQGTILAGSIKALATKANSKVAGADGDFKADIQLTGSANAKVKQTLGSAKIGGGIINSFWEILVGDIGTIAAGIIDSSTIRAGVLEAVPQDELPEDAADYTALHSAIGSFSLKGIKTQPKGSPTFIDSILAAWDLGSLKLGVIDTSSTSGLPIGVSANAIKSIAGVTETETLPKKAPFVPNIFDDFKLVLVS